MRTRLWTRALPLAAALCVAIPSTAAAGPPTIESESVSGVTASDAVLEAEINPQSDEQSAMYQFQLARDPGEFASQFACPPEWEGSSLCLGLIAQEDALPLGWAAAGTEGQPVSLDLASAGVVLQPEATYHYRIISALSIPAFDVFVWEEPIAMGTDHTFTTGEAGECSSAPGPPKPKEPTELEPPREPGCEAEEAGAIDRPPPREELREEGGGGQESGSPGLVVVVSGKPGTGQGHRVHRRSHRAHRHWHSHRCFRPRRHHRVGGPQGRNRRLSRRGISRACAVARPS